MLGTRRRVWRRDDTGRAPREGLLWRIRPGPRAPGAAARDRVSASVAKGSGAARGAPLPSTRGRGEGGASQALWPATFVAAANLANLVAEVRAALGDEARKPRFIRTVHRFGYAFCGDALGATAAPSRPPALYRLESRGSQVELRDGENLLGRIRQSVLPLNSSTVSRHHALIRISDDAAMLEDLGSKNGTRLGGRRLTEPTRLQDGDGSAWAPSSWSSGRSSMAETRPKPICGPIESPPYRSRLSEEFPPHSWHSARELESWASSSPPPATTP